MKRKIFFILILFCSAGLVSSGKNNRKCCSHSLYSVKTKISYSCSDSQKGFDLSPLRLFVLDI